MRTKVDQTDVEVVPSVSGNAPAATGPATAVGQAILAVDSGITAVGWAVIVDGKIEGCGCVRSACSAKKPAVCGDVDDVDVTRHARYLVIVKKLWAIIRNGNVKRLIAETPASGARTWRADRSRVILLDYMAKKLGLSAVSIPPGSTKLVGGSKDASREAVERAILARWPNAPLPKAKCARKHVVEALSVFVAAEAGIPSESEPTSENIFSDRWLMHSLREVAHRAKKVPCACGFTLRGRNFRVENY